MGRKQGVSSGISSDRNEEKKENGSMADKFLGLFGCGPKKKPDNKRNNGFSMNNK